MSTKQDEVKRAAIEQTEQVRMLVADWDKSRERRDMLTVADKMALEGRILAYVYQLSLRERSNHG